VSSKTNNTAIASGLLFTIFLWGASNTGTKYLVHVWPPVFTGCMRLFVAGVIFTCLLRWTKIFGETHPVTPKLNRELWWRCGLVLAVYVIIFNWAMKLIPAAHVTLYLASSPVWALVCEERPRRNWRSLLRYGAAALALSGVVVLMWPVLRGNMSDKVSTNLPGEVLGFLCAPIWTVYGLQCRRFVSEFSGAEISAESFWRSGVILMPVAGIELLLLKHPLPMNTKYALIQSYCVLGGSIGSFALWNGALKHWKTSKVYLFNNLIPLSTMIWAHFCLGEGVTQTFWWAMLLIVSGVLLGQADWQRIFGTRWLPED